MVGISFEYAGVLTRERKKKKEKKLFGRGPAAIFSAAFQLRIIPTPAPKDAQDC